MITVFHLWGVLLTKSTDNRWRYRVYCSYCCFCFYSKRRTPRLKADSPFRHTPLASLLGHDVAKLRLLAFGLSGLFTTTAATLIALDVGFDPQCGLNAVLFGIGVNHYRRQDFILLPGTMWDLAVQPVLGLFGMSALNTP